MAEAPWYKPTWFKNGYVMYLCRNTECQKHFTTPPFTGTSGKVYCSVHCRMEMYDEDSITERARRMTK